MTDRLKRALNVLLDTNMQQLRDETNRAEPWIEQAENSLEVALRAAVLDLLEPDEGDEQDAQDARWPHEAGLPFAAGWSAGYKAAIAQIKARIGAEEKPSEDG